MVQTTAGLFALSGWAIFVALRYLTSAAATVFGVGLAVLAVGVGLVVMAVGAACVLAEQVRDDLFPGDGRWGKFWQTYRIMRNRREHALEAGFPGLQKDAGRIEALRIAFRNTFTAWK